MKKVIIVLLLFFATRSDAQTTYFPPTTGTVWDTTSPAMLGWCPDRIDSLYSYLDAHNTDAFIVLKDGRIVLEKYFGTFTVDSVHYWASASKSLTSVLTGIAQEHGLLHITDTVSHIIGAGWTTAPAAKENMITIRNLLTMTSGLNDTAGAPCSNTDSSAGCLRYLADAGTRWAYHTGAYYKLEAAISAASGLNYNTFTSTYIGNTIGMTGLWYQNEYISKPRSMARFGLLALNKGIWGNDTVLHDTAYFHAMVNTSQTFNPAYGYLWWLNGKTSFISPGSQFVFPGALVSNAPADMFAALGKNDQKIYVVPSQHLVVVRSGESAYGVALALSPFDDELWGKIDSLGYGCTSATGIVNEAHAKQPTIYPNPASGIVSVTIPQQVFDIELYDVTGRLLFAQQHVAVSIDINCSKYNEGVYLVRTTTANKEVATGRLLLQK